MPDTMARKRKKPTEAEQQHPAEDERPKQPSSRTGTPLHAWIDDEIAGAFQEYIESTDPRVSKTASLETALKEFLRSRGFWPRKKRPDA